MSKVCLLPKYLAVSFLLLASCGELQPGENSAETSRARSDIPADFNAYVDAVMDVSWDSIQQIVLQSDKPLIVYFSGYACVNARRIEDKMLHDEELLPLLQDRKMVILMVDEKRTLPNGEKFVSEFNGDSIRQYGQRAAEIQRVKFRNNSQPYFLKLDANARVIGSLTYADSPEKRALFFAQ